MERLVGIVTIDAPVEYVFAYLSEPSNQLDFWPHMEEIRKIERLPNGGASYRWPYRLNGSAHEGSSEDVEFVRNERIVTRSEGPIDSTFVWHFEPLHDKTRLMVECEYTVAIPMHNALVEDVICAVAERDFWSLLANLQNGDETIKAWADVDSRPDQLVEGAMQSVGRPA